MAKIKEISIVKDEAERHPFITVYKDKYRINWLPYELDKDGHKIPKLGKVTGLYIKLYRLKEDINNYTIDGGYITGIAMTDLEEVTGYSLKIVTE